MAVGPFALATLAAAKDYLNIPASVTADDSFIEVMIDAATARAEGFARRRLKARDYVHDFDGTGAPDLMLKEYPVNSVAEVNIDGTRQFGAATVIGALFYVVSGDEMRVTFDGAFVGDGGFPRGTKIVRVKYNAGYATVPDDLALAVKMIVRRQFTRSREGADGIVTQSWGGYSATYQDGFDPEVREILERYRRGV